MSITITDSAKRFITKALHNRGKGVGVSIELTKSGCSGFSYKVEFIDEQKSDDLFSVESINENYALYVSNEAIALLGGIAVDAVDSQFKSGLDIRGAQQDNECGCGKSFSVATK